MNHRTWEIPAESQRTRVLARSMGGLILANSLYLGEQRVRHGWLFGAPLNGTNVVYVVYGIALLAMAAQIGSGLGWALLFAAVFLSAALRQMLPGSDLLNFVSSRYDGMPNLTSVFCAMDLIVFSNPLKEPGSSSRFRRETDVLFPEAGHNNLVMGDNAIHAIVQALENAHRTAQTASAIHPAA